MLLAQKRIFLIPTLFLVYINNQIQNEKQLRNMRKKSHLKLSLYVHLIPFSWTQNTFFSLTNILLFLQPLWHKSLQKK